MPSGSPALDPGVSTYRPRVLLLSTDMGMGGGAEEQVIALAYGLQDRGWEPRIVSLVPPSPMPDGFSARGIPLDHLNMRRVLPDPRGLWKLIRLIRTFQPDVVHTHLVHANLIARVARVLAPVPVLINTHHSLTMAGVERDRSAVFEFAHRWTDALADHSTAICHAAAQAYSARRVVPASRMSVIPNGIIVNDYRRDPHTRAETRRALGVDESFVWLAVGRLEPSKDYPTLLRAFARLGDEPRTLLIAGQGTLRQELESLTQTLGISNRVRFLGLRSDVSALMAAADGFALSSRLEGLPLVLLQASAAELPVVATRVAGNGEVVEQGASGYLVDAGDDAEFARWMRHVETLAEAERLQLGRAGLRRVESTYCLERVLDRWISLYQNLLAPTSADASLPQPTNHPRRIPRRLEAAPPTFAAVSGVDTAQGNEDVI